MTTKKELQKQVIILQESLYKLKEQINNLEEKEKVVRGIKSSEWEVTIMLLTMAVMYCILFLICGYFQ